MIPERGSRQYDGGTTCDRRGSAKVFRPLDFLAAPDVVGTAKQRTSNQESRVRGLQLTTRSQ